MTHFGTYQNPFIGWLPDGGRSFKWEERSVLGDVRGEYGCVIDQSVTFIYIMTNKRPSI